MLDRIQDTNGNAITINRRITADITRITSPSGKYVDFAYDTFHRVTRITDHAGRTVTYEYNTGSQGSTLFKVTNPNFETSEYGYQEQSRMATVKNARGIVKVTNLYDATTGRVIRQTLADTGTYQFAYTLAKKTGAIQQTDVTTPRGTVRRYVFDANGYKIAETLISGASQQQMSYMRQAGSELVLQVTDPLGRKTDYTYDTCGNRTFL